MQSDNQKKPALVVILGPTAVGKTEFAIQLAERLNGEVISADSRQFYRGMDIGTAKPTPKQLKRVRHHLIDVAEPDEVWNLAIFQREADKSIQGVLSRGRLPFLVGGTGQYIRAVVEGWEIPRMKPDESMRSILSEWAEEIGSDGLHDRLAVLDQNAADRIDYRNLRRTIRALEVILRTGKLFSTQRRKKSPKYNILQLGITRPREELYKRVDARIDWMLQAGFIEEVKGLLAQGHSPDLATMSAIGYGEIIAYLQGRLTLDEALRLIKRRTRVFVRRQANWFKPDDANIHWFPVDATTLNRMEHAVLAWLHVLEQ